MHIYTKENPFMAEFLMVLENVSSKYDRILYWVSRYYKNTYYVAFLLDADADEFCEISLVKWRLIANRFTF